MTEWSAVVLAPPEDETGPMASRLPSYLHPISGRPLLWHTIRGMLECSPRRVVLLAPSESATDLFGDLPLPVETYTFDFAAAAELEQIALPVDRVVMIHASAVIAHAGLTQLLAAPTGSWIGPENDAIAAVLSPEMLSEQLCLRDPFTIGGPSLLRSDARLDFEGSFRVRTRADLARAHRRVRDELVRLLMEGGVTFLLPETVMVDVDVRIGRDTILFPGVSLEGQTTIGAETVVGPGCRIIDSWIGSGVELKGWNYIAHTSVRNRAILEPYVRRGFD